jgi:DNA polymerase bacteriophage-type
MGRAIVHLDFELAGVLDLGEVGADTWTRHAGTQLILTGFAVGDDPPRAVVHDDEGSQLRDLFTAIEAGAEIHAWNAAFEWAVWNNICVPRCGWPPLPIERFYCVMAAAACAGLPMSLDAAADAVGSPFVKDKALHGVMKRMARPRTFDVDGAPVWWHCEAPLPAKATTRVKEKAEAKTNAMLQGLITYNLADVEAERAIDQRIPRLSVREREIWLVDQHMNQRGLPVDRRLLTALHELTLQELLRISTDVYRITGGVTTAQHVKLLAWLRARGYPHTSLAKDTLPVFVASPGFHTLPQDVQEVLLLRAEAAKTSTAKLAVIDGYSMFEPNCARNLVQYGGAVRTLRWAGRGPQIQNFPRPVIKHVDLAIAEILDGMDANGLRMLFGRPLDVVSSCLRSVFKAPEGFKFVVCDYHAIEAIVLAWLAQFKNLLDVFRNGEDVYVFTAQGIGSNNRTLGKVLRLACGYGMGPAKFQDTAATYNLKLTTDEAITAVQAFRESNRPIVNLWRACETFAKRAIMNPGEVLVCGQLRFRMADPKRRLAGALLMELPSGRNLVYRNARVEDGRIIFWGVHQITRQWGELDTYGGKLTENATQAVARDLLADAIVDLDREFPGVLLTTVHDEIVAMTRTDDAPRLFERVKTVMNAPPAWAAGMPLSSAGGISARYSKL